MEKKLFRIFLWIATIIVHLGFFPVLLLVYILDFPVRAYKRCKKKIDDVVSKEYPD